MPILNEIKGERSEGEAFTLDGMNEMAIFQEAERKTEDENLWKTMIEQDKEFKCPKYRG
jgi:hypothetical protein